MRLTAMAVWIGLSVFGMGSASAQGFVRSPMSVGEKFSYFEERVFGPRALVMSSIGSGIRMLHPPSQYPPEWRTGTAAFGRYMGDRYARHAAEGTARFAASALLHEDPRYQRSASSAFFPRLAHALGCTFSDRTEGGRRTVAVSNFAGAAAGGFVGNAYLPDGFNDTRHAG